MINEKMDPGRLLVTGGCGFIGSNLAAHFLDKGWQVCIYDSFVREGTEINAAWLEERGNGRLSILRGDVRDYIPLHQAMQGVDVVVHLAAQVAVTSSVKNPLYDFSVNALGGLHVLEAARNCDPSPIVLYASTNKVYGQLENQQRTSGNLRYTSLDHPQGVSEEFPIDLHSPYGCSKGICDLYAIDYDRIYGLKTVVFRQSCIYGPRQFGVEDQGWMAHFVISALLGRPITIFGDGRQVRDVLHIGDLISVYERAIERIDDIHGRAYNIGGGPENASSLLEMIYRLEARFDRAIPLIFSQWRPGDQRIYVSDIRQAKLDLDWEPRMGVEDGLEELCQWVEDHQDLIETVALESERKNIPLVDSVVSGSESAIDILKE
jgi:CDP-paratose 2-epimerase